MPQIFISYRWSDTEIGRRPTGKNLRARFGDEAVFAVTEKIMGKKQLGLFTFLFLIAGTLAEAQQPGESLQDRSSIEFRSFALEYRSISTGIARVRLP